jgi:hypothetical protein
MDKQFAYQQRALKPTTMWLLFLFLGWSYGSMGKMGKQIFYYLTLGGIGFWIIYRLFTLNGAIRKYNKQIAYDCGFTNDEVIKLGLY